jgi:uncharacterized membrane protein YdjX (TVP38/TMEM64 family)
MRGSVLFILLVVIAAAASIIPYLVLGDIASFAAGYLFWTLLTLVVIVVFGFWLTSRWGRS